MKLFDTRDREVAPAPLAVMVNGVEIPSELITREIQNHPAESPMAAREAAANALVVKELLLTEARRLNIAATPLDLGDGLRETEEDAMVRMLLDEAVAVPTPTDEECRRFYNTNITRFQSPTIWEPSHILFAAGASDADARKQAQEAAAKTIELLHEHPEQFAQLARQNSDCPSREQGGNLGQVSGGQTTAQFEEALQQLQPGELVRAPVETQYGFHVIRLDRRVDGETLPFEAVQEKIADYLADKVFHKAVHQFVSLLAGHADIQGVDIERTTSPLLQ